MVYRRLGGTDLHVSEIGFGTWGLGGDSYGVTEDRTSLDAIALALERGITFFDTADCYGRGRSERLLGKGLGACRQDVVIATKAGMVSRVQRNFDASYVQRSVEGSLQRLNTDYVDVLQLHSPREDDIVQAVETCGWAGRLVEEGKVGAVGVSVSRPEDAGAFVRAGVRVIQVNFNLLDQRVRASGLLALARAEDVGLIARTPLCFGFLTGRYAGDEAFGVDDHRSLWSIQQRKLWAQGIRRFDTKDEESDIMFALNFCLSYPEISTVIPGMLTPAHVEENCRAAGLPPMDCEALNQLFDTYNEQSFIVK